MMTPIKWFGFAIVWLILSCYASAGEAVYHRQEWPSWLDEDNDCLRTRDELLTERSLVDVVVQNCRVISGMWYDPYSDRIFYHADELYNDHVVPLQWAFNHGAHHWPQDKKNQFANDPTNLQFVFTPLDRDKGEMGISEWLPPNNRFVCSYAALFQHIVDKYDLYLEPADYYVLAWCGGPWFPHVHVPLIDQQLQDAQILPLD